MGQRGPRASHSSGGARGSPSPPSPPLLPPPERNCPNRAAIRGPPAPSPAPTMGPPAPRTRCFGGNGGSPADPSRCPPIKNRTRGPRSQAAAPGVGGSRGTLDQRPFPRLMIFFFFLPFLLFSRLLFLIFWGYFWDANSGRPNWNQSRGGGSLTIREDFLGFANF